MRLEFDFIHHQKSKYIIGYHYGNDPNKRGLFKIPIGIYNMYMNLQPFESLDFNIKKGAQKVILTRVTNICNNGYKMKLQFSDNTLYISEEHFMEKIKSYTFQTFVDVKVYDGNNNLEYHNYKFLYNYDTRLKVGYFFINKFITKFIMYNKKWLIGNDLIHDIMDKAIELYNNDIMYERQAIFKLKDRADGYAIYTFMVISVQKG